jgi:hypothetical protein
MVGFIFSYKIADHLKTGPKIADRPYLYCNHKMRPIWKAWGQFFLF